jgi:hypothetical protein
VGAAGTCHVVPLAALLPGTRYYYRLRANGTIVQTTNYFTTLRAPVDPGDVFFTVVGDWGDTPNATTGQCGEATFPGPSPVCTFTASGSTLRCR